MKRFAKAFSGAGILVILVVLTVPAFAVTADPDAEVLGLLQEINQREIKAAEMAQQKSNIDPEVDHYAKMIEKEHSKNLEKNFVLTQLSGIVPLETDAVVNERNKSMEEIAKLKALNGAQFASAYLVAMVNGHNETLKLLDSKAGQLKNKDMQKLVAETRDHVQEHLKKAREVQEELTKP